jgi:hypothetical protein
MWYFVIFAKKNHQFKNHIEIDIFFFNLNFFSPPLIMYLTFF